MPRRQQKRIHEPLRASTVAATVTEALEEGEAGGLGDRSTGHDVILCCGVGSWEGDGMGNLLGHYFRGLMCSANELTCRNRTITLG